MTSCHMEYSECTTRSISPSRLTKSVTSSGSLLTNHFLKLLALPSGRLVAHDGGPKR
jgi:hypothetical protein